MAAAIPAVITAGATMWGASKAAKASSSAADAYTNMSMMPELKDAIRKKLLPNGPEEQIINSATERAQQGAGFLFRGNASQALGAKFQLGQRGAEKIVANRTTSTNSAIADMLGLSGNARMGVDTKLGGQQDYYGDMAGAAGYLANSGLFNWDKILSKKTKVPKDTKGTSYRPSYF